jgi:hypothetical protein
MQLIAVTGYAADAEALTAAGFDGHMLKPVNFHELQETLASITASRGLNASQRERRPAGHPSPAPPDVRPPSGTVD